MGIVGKIVGGTIGFALGGPLGAIAGAVFGHAFDSSEESGLQGRSESLSGIEQTQLAFFVSTFSMLAKLAQADGQVRNEEIDTVEAFAVRDLKLNPAEREVALNIFRAALASPARFEDFALQFYQRFQNNHQIIEMMVDILVRVSVADGVINRAEEALLLHAVRIFQMGEQRYGQIKSRYTASENQAYEVLGCRPDDSDESIKKRYRTLVQSYHPDKIAGKGLPEEFIDLAHEKFREIQKAYETVKQERGLK